MKKYPFTIHIRGRYISFTFDFELFDQHIVFSVFTEDTEMQTLVGGHFHLFCPLDNLSAPRWAVHHLAMDERDLKAEIAKVVAKQYLAL